MRGSLTLTLVLDGDDLGSAEDVIDAMLDAGSIQDAIAEHFEDQDVAAKIVMARLGAVESADTIELGDVARDTVRKKGAPSTSGTGGPRPDPERQAHAAQLQDQRDEALASRDQLRTELDAHRHYLALLLADLSNALVPVGLFHDELAVESLPAPDRALARDAGFSMHRICGLLETAKMVARGAPAPRVSGPGGEGEPICAACEGTRVVDHVPHAGTSICDPGDVREAPCPECTAGEVPC